MIRIIPLLLVLFVCSPVLAIEVQPTAEPYEPIVITHEEGVNIQIIPWGGTVPRFLDDRFIKRPIPELTVFCAPPGAYIVFGGGGMGIVIIEGDFPEPPPPPPPPPVPSQIQEISRQGAATLNDPTTTADLVTALTNAVNQTRGSPLEAQVAAVKAAISTTLLNRKGASRQKDWLELWRKPVDAAVANLNPQTNYIAIIEAIVAGLKQAAPSNTPLSRTDKPYAGVVVTFQSTTRFPCQYCDVVKKELLPTIIKGGATVIEVEAEVNTPIPRLSIQYGGKKAPEHFGVMSVAQFEGVIAGLR